MKKSDIKPEDSVWIQFIMNYGFRASSYDLAAVVGRTVDDVEYIRRTHPQEKLAKHKEFGELFTLWNGRPPTDDEWPAPRMFGGKSQVYAWQGPELALLASLVGTMGVPEICQVLTARLIQKTGNPAAVRGREAVQLAMNRMGLQVGDLLGGISIPEAGRQVGSINIVNQLIREKKLKAFKCGRRWVIPYEEWEGYKAGRTFPPKGYVMLADLKVPLAIKSDKLSEFARAGLIPKTIRCNPFGHGKGTQFGTWWIDGTYAKQLVKDRRAGRPMPWHGKPDLGNLQVTYKLWKERQHPDTCETCMELWGEAGAPGNFEDYKLRYPPLLHGAKRHLTRKWNPGMTVAETAVFAGTTRNQVAWAIQNGMLETTQHGRRRTHYVSQTEATRWIARKMPTGHSSKSWISLDTACGYYLFTLQELRGYINDGTLIRKIGTDGAAAGIEYVSRHQCGQLRQRIGFTEEQAAKRVGVSIPKLKKLMGGTLWRKATGIPLTTVQAIIKRLQSQEGYTIEAAAEKLGETVQWVQERKNEGVIKVTKTKWDERRTYITEPMLKRLQAYQANPVKIQTFGPDWLKVSEAAQEALVTVGTIYNWEKQGLLASVMAPSGKRYHQQAVRAQARIYWQSCRFHRATPPAWLQAEYQQKQEAA